VLRHIESYGYPTFPSILNRARIPSRAVVRMGFISVESVQGINGPENGPTTKPAEADRDGFRSFEVAGLASDTPTSTAMKEEIVLASWLLVLLRTQEDGRVSFDWNYKGQEDGIELEPVNSLSSDQVMPNLQSSIKQVTAAISSQIEKVASRPRPPSSLILSTSSLSQTTEGMDEVSIHPYAHPDQQSINSKMTRVSCILKFVTAKIISRFDQFGRATVFCLIQ
jgi:hypothetical protein